MLSFISMKAVRFVFFLVLFTSGPLKIRHDFRNVLHLVTNIDKDFCNELIMIPPYDRHEDA